PAEAVVDPEDRLEVAEQVLAGEVRGADLGDPRGPAEAATDEDLEPVLARILGVLDHADADVVELDGRAVTPGPGHGDLELAGQERELRVEGRPLPDDLAV